MKKLVYIIFLCGYFGQVKSAVSTQVRNIVGNGADSTVVQGDSSVKVLELPDQIFPDRTRDLVIINDVSENVGKNWHYIGFPFSHEIVNIPQLFKLLYALQEEQLVLTTKSLFYQVQLMAEKWDDLLLDQENFLNIYRQKYNHYIPRKETTFIDLEDQKIMKDTDFIKTNIFVENFNRLYEQFLQDRFMGDGYFDDAAQDIMSLLSEKEFYQAIYLFLYKTLYKKFLTLQYQCKEVDQNFLLFVPKKLQDEVRGIRQESLKNIYMGLQYRKLKDYDYNRLYGLDKSAMLRSVPQYEHIGEYLFRALDMLLPDYSNMKHNRPEFNIFLAGHGQSGYVAAIHKDIFNKILKLFQDRLFMKSLTIDTCSIGGRQFKDVYNIQDMYTSQTLQSITYTMLFIGSFYAPTVFQLTDFNENQFTSNFEQKELRLRNIFKDLFAYLNENPPSFYKAVKLWENLLIDDKSFDKGYITNYVSIKFPHTSWIVPSDYDKRVQRLSRVEAASFYQKDFILSKSKKIILLGTEIIPSCLVVNSVIKSVHDIANNLPIMLPVNYTTHAYRIAQIRLSNVLVPLTEGKINFISKILRHMFLTLSYKIQDPVFIFIDKFIFGNKEIKNVWIDIFSGNIFFNTDDNLSHFVHFDNTGSFTSNTGPEYQSIIDHYTSYFDSDIFQNKLRSMKDIHRLDKKITSIYDKPAPQVIQDSRKQYEKISADKKNQGAVSSTTPIDDVLVSKAKRRVHNPYSWGRKNVNN